MMSEKNKMTSLRQYTPQLSEAVNKARIASTPLVALESTVISHGLPYPDNIEIALACEEIILREGATPATIGIIDGIIKVGLSRAELQLLATAPSVRKVSRRDFGIVLARKEHGATTVAGTMIVAHMAGIRIFTTGGIGGVHRGDEGDISADLPELSQTPVAVICAGAKSILDFPRTLEWLETAGVPIIGYQTNTFPAFYSTSSGLPIDHCANDAAEIAVILQAHWHTGISGGALVVMPPPLELALDYNEMENAIQQALKAARQEGIKGKAVTPYLLGQVSQITKGKSLAVNKALLIQNARLAAQIAVSMG
jgi:pseudouridine-5'-phosphate glycosidase